MWELLENGAALEVGNRLRYRFLIEGNEIINEGVISQIGDYYFWLLTLKNNNNIIPEENQQMIQFRISNLDNLGFERWVELPEN